MEEDLEVWPCGHVSLGAGLKFQKPSSFTVNPLSGVCRSRCKISVAILAPSLLFASILPTLMVMISNSLGENSEVLSTDKPPGYQC